MDTYGYLLSDKVNDVMPEAKFKIIRKCRVCGDKFRAKSLDSFYCSHRCSDIAFKRRKREKEREAKYKECSIGIPDQREYISVPEAVAMFAIGRTTLYRMIRTGQLPAVNIGKRAIRIKRCLLEQNFRSRTDGLADNQKPLVKTYCMEPEDCYTIGEISEKFQISASTVYAAIRRYSIPIRQIGKFVYAPKSEIDNILS